MHEKSNFRVQNSFTQFLSGSTQYFLSNTVDHILIGRSHIGRAPKNVLADRKGLRTVHSKQTSSIQANTKTSLDIQYPTLGLHQSNIRIIQFQNKVLRNMVNAPSYIRNNDLHRDLEVDVVSSEIQKFAQKHKERLHHENTEPIQLLDNMGIVCRLQRKKLLS